MPKRPVPFILCGAVALVGVCAITFAGLDAARPSVGVELQPLPYPMIGVAAGGPRDQYRYVWAPGALESTRMYATDALVLRVVRKRPDKRAIYEIATRLGIAVTPEEYAGMPEVQKGTGFDSSAYMRSFEQMNVEDQRLFDCKDVDVWDNGCFSYWHRGGTPSPGSPNGPWAVDALSPERTREIAERFIADSGLLPEGCEFERVRTAVTQNAQGIEIYSADQAPPRVVSRQVVYTRRVEGIPLDSFSIDVNGNGEVYRVTRRIPNFAPWVRYPMLSPDEARRMLPQGLLPSHIWGPATAVIDHVSLSYTREWNLSNLIQPVYTFSGTAHCQGGLTDTFSVTWPAVRPEYLMPPER